MNMRGRWLEPLKRDSIPSRFILLDCGLDLTSMVCSPNVHELTADLFHAAVATWDAGKFTVGTTAQFETRNEFWTWLRENLLPLAVTWVMGFRLYEQAAVIGLFRRLENRNIVIREGSDSDADELGADREWTGCCITGDPPTIIDCRFAGGGPRMRWVDVRNYGVGEEVLPDAEEDRFRELTTFVEDYIGLITRYGFGSLQPTAAAQTVTAWRRSYQSERVHIHDCPEAITLERAALFGGRCEPRFIGTIKQSVDLLAGIEPQLISPREIAIAGPVYHLDVNSAYPAAGSTQLIPTCLALYTQNPSLGLAAEMMEGKVSIAKVTIRSDVVTYPKRDQESGLVVYPIGRYRTSLADPELRLAVNAGHVVKIHELATYIPGCPFAVYFSRLYSLRLQARDDGNIRLESAIKSMLVSFHGKLAQKPQQWVPVLGHKSPIGFGSWFGARPGTDDVVRWRTIGWNTEYQAAADEGNMTFPGVSSVIQSIVRTELGGAIETCGLDHVFYYDTDSLFTDHVGFLRLVASGCVSADELGKWKLLGTYNTVEIRGIKNYIADTVRVCAGLRFSDRDVAGPANTAPQMHTMDSSVLAQTAPLPIVIERKNEPNGTYKHGRVLPSGFVKPFYYWED